MTLYAPFYYTGFACTADKCRHSCCIGWEIDIDKDTLQFYKTIDGSLGERLKNNIAETNEISHFILREDERCPFLNENGLCDIISQLGEGALCQICDDHPRFRNFYSDRIEIGVGMCCEAAAQLILSQTEKFRLVCLENDGDEYLYPEEEEFLAVREHMLEILTDRALPLENRIQNLLDFCEISLPQKTIQEWADFYLSLERLDNEWTVILHQLKNTDVTQLSVPETEKTSNAFEQLLCYFIYRHLTDSLDDNSLWQRVAFSVHSYCIIRSLCAVHYSKNGSLSVEDIAGFARLYSSEIEYSEDNMEKLLNVMSQQ
ncbi:MAG: hypothetical protein E7484_00700 [Ruminococcaceae bacterium]|nr:hypothetical protein [Oscillospiraceae bacterium]